MIDITTLKKYDASGMYKIYDKWPEIAKSSYESNQCSVDLGNIDHITFAGMGGSGAIGDLFSAILSKTSMHVSTVKGYLLPNTVDENTLVIATSISGDTDETIQILNSANKLNCSTIAFSSGGKIKNYCEENNINYKYVPKYHSARASFVNYVYSALRVLESIIPIHKNDVLESIQKMNLISKNISSNNLTNSNDSLEFAYWITGIPLMYYPLGLQAAAIRFKNSLQENSKSHAFIEDIIESCHNGIVAWERSSQLKPVLLEGKDDYIKTKERWTIIKEYFQSHGIEYKEVFSTDGSILSKLITLIYFFDYVSIYYAIISKLDPTPVKSIEFIKNKLVDQ